jgi:LacI family transcriptional regulator
MRDAELDVPLGCVEVVGFLEQDGFDAAKRLLALDPQPEVFFVSNVDMTIGAIRAIHQCGLRAPDDIGIIGFDEFPFASILVPPLTTIEQPIEMLAFTAVDLLMRRVANRVSSDPVRVRLSPKLNVRGSTRTQPIHAVPTAAGPLV